MISTNEHLPKLTEDDFSRLVQDFRHTAFRLETLPVYDVPEERCLFSSYLAGDLKAPAEDEWVEFVKQATLQRKRISRVHLLPQKLTPYLRFEIEWGYVHSAQVGEDIHLVLSSTAISDLDRADGDFWLFDDDTAIVLDYTPGGAFQCARRVVGREHLDRLRATRDRVMKNALPLTKYLSLCRTGIVS